MPGLAAKSAGKAAEIDGAGAVPGAAHSEATPTGAVTGFTPVDGKTAVVLVSRRDAEIGQWIGLQMSRAIRSGIRTEGIDAGDSTSSKLPTRKTTRRPRLQCNVIGVCSSQLVRCGQPRIQLGRG